MLRNGWQPIDFALTICQSWRFYRPHPTPSVILTPGVIYAMLCNVHEIVHIDLNISVRDSLAIRIMQHIWLIPAPIFYGSCYNLYTV